MVAVDARSPVEAVILPESNAARAQEALKATLLHLPGEGGARPVQETRHGAPLAAPLQKLSRHLRTLGMAGFVIDFGPNDFDRRGGLGEAGQMADFSCPDQLDINLGAFDFASTDRGEGEDGGRG